MDQFVFLEWVGSVWCVFIRYPDNDLLDDLETRGMFNGSQLVDHPTISKLKKVSYKPYISTTQNNACSAVYEVLFKILLSERVTPWFGLIRGNSKRFLFLLRFSLLIVLFIHSAWMVHHHVSTVVSGWRFCVSSKITLQTTLSYHL